MLLQQAVKPLSYVKAHAADIILNITLLQQRLLR